MLNSAHKQMGPKDMDVPQDRVVRRAGWLYSLLGISTADLDLARRIGLRIAGFVALLVGSESALAAAYVYDANGRLIAVTNDAGDTARYHYDGLGNITRVQRLPSGALAIFDFTPRHGGAGDRVTLKGQGFSATAAQNVVRFNGVVADVVAASTSSLTTIVPSAATTGVLTVAVGNQTASSDVPFVVDAQPRAPLITAVSPHIASVGAALTISGQSLLPLDGQTSARIGLAPLVLGQASNTTLQAEVPGGASSGRIRVTTPYGSAVSADDVLVVPAGVDDEAIATAKRLAVDGQLNDLSTASAGQSVAILFDAQGGDYISAQFSELASELNYALYGIGNKRLAAGTVSANAPSFHMPALKSAGTHLLVLTPKAGPLTWKLQLERSAVLDIGGAAQDVSTSIAGQSRRLVFDASKGLPLGLGVAEKTGPPAWGSATVTVQGPDGGQAGFQQCTQANNGCSLNLSALNTGRHAVLITPAASGTRLLAFQAVLSTDAQHTLARGTPLALSLPRAGQNARLRFTGTAGEVLGLLVAGQATLPSGRSVYYRVNRPDGTLWKSVAASSGLVMNLALPVTGTYEVFVDAGYGETLATEVLLRGNEGSPVIDGATSTHVAARAGEAAYFQITASSGDSLGLGISGLTIANGSVAAVNVYRPSGTLLANTTCHAANAGCDLNLSLLEEGVHGVEVVPLDPAQTMQFDATVSRDLAMNMARATPTALSLPRHGQNARLAFTAAANEVIALKITAQTTQPSAAGVYFRALRPDGVTVTSGYAAGDKTLLIDTSVAGTYRIFVDPEHGATTTATLTLEAGVLGQMELDGSIGEYEGAAGKDVSFAINAVAGKHLGFGISHLSVNSGTYVRIYAYTPSGASVGNETYCYVSNGGCDVQLYNPVSGTYSIVMRPVSSTQTMKFRATLSSALRATLSRDVPFNLSLDRRGQDALMTFNGLAGETVALQIAGQSSLPAGRTVTYRVYKPSERRSSYHIASIAPETGGALNIRLPENGEYWVYADPQFGAAAAARITLSTGTTSGLVRDGASVAFAADQPGQTAHYSFNAIAGQHMGFAVSDLSVSDGTYVRIYAYGPNGNSIEDDSYCYVERGGCDVDIYNPVAGSYSVVVVPSLAGQRIQFTATLSSSAPAELAPDTPAMLQLSRRGQDGMLTFSGNQGDTVGLQIAGQASAPAGNTVRYRIFKPSERRRGYHVAEAFPQNGGAVNMSLPETGTYWIWIDPDYGAAVSAQITLSSGTAGGLHQNGGSVGVETVLPGQTAYFRFNATAGQHLGFGLSDLVVSSGTLVRIYAYAPNGNNIQDDSYCYVADGGCDIDIYSPVTGTYSVMVAPEHGDQAMQFNATLSSSVGVALERDVPAVLDLTRRGQDGLMTFTGTQGENLAFLVAGQTTVPGGRQVTYRVFKPSDRRSGYYIYSFNAETGGSMNMVLPETGTYWIWADPVKGATSRSHVTLSTGTASGMERDGGVAQFASTQPGQSAHFRFNATAGQHLGFAVSDLAVSANNHVRISAYAPNGNSIADTSYCYVADGGCDIDVYNPVAGTYSIIVSAAEAGQTMQFRAGLSSSATPALARDVPLNLQLDRRGKDAVMTFTGNAGESLALLVAGQSTVPTERTARYLVYKPSERRRGYEFGAITATTGGWINMILPESGTYWLWVDPDSGAMTNAKVTLSTGSANPLVLDGSPTQFASTQAGQSAHFRFPATAGGHMGVAITGLSLSEGSYVRVQAYSPTGVSVSDTSYCYVSDGGCDIDFYNTVAGDYSILVQPTTNGQTMQFTATLSSNAGIALQRGVAAPLELSRRGQDGLLTFTGSQGEKVTLQVSAQVTQPARGRVAYSVFKPSDRRRGYAISTITPTTAANVNLTLPEAGTYWILVDPDFGRSVSANVSVSTSP
ncbi:IPT/TIG domain-containing protein [Xanthomonas sp. A2111]|uniref:IPT/TIG domain-containing protein n=1 Tax=Xanthomonas hawaiiensis TaxID=3003247 RepID=A0ABU2I0S0_9XANT|nr:IPT/TIG domain-containing protein [Xanthomonas sp. A2111]MDS9991738.1 IPT/TIG domain-containing protein [Xanthomonas sp. A2111]